MVKGVFITFLLDGHSLSGEDSSLPQSGQIFITSICEMLNFINDLMKMGFFNQILLQRDAPDCPHCTIKIMQHEQWVTDRSHHKLCQYGFFSEDCTCSNQKTVIRKITIRLW